MGDDKRPEDEERRATPRVDVRLPARVHMGDEVIEAQTIDISHDAVLIGGPGFPTDIEIEIEIQVADGWQRLAAAVVRRQEIGAEGARLAATFAEAASAGGREAITAFVQRHLDGYRD